MKLTRRNKRCQVGTNSAKYLILAFTIFLSLALFIPTKAKAEQRLIDQQIHVKLNKDGSADITDLRKVQLEHGTENFIVIGNLGKSKIKNFTVSENGKEYKYEDDWNIDATREEKKSKYGIIKDGKEYELCWGIGEYGYHEYTVKYTVTDLIKGLKDGQMLFWKFINDDQDIPPERMKIIVESYRPFTQDPGEKDIWAFGYEGSFKIEDGKAVAISSSPLSSADYVTLLMRFPENMFKTEDNLNKTFKKVQKKAFKNSDFKPEESFFLHSIVKPIMEFLTCMAIIGGIFIAFSMRFGKSFTRQYRNEYWRDIPFDGHFLELSFITNEMHLDKMEDKMNALLLKWIMEGKIEVLKGEAEGVFFKRKATDLKFLTREVTPDMISPERKLFRMMLSASKDGEMLTETDFIEWARKHRSRLTDWSYQSWQYSTRHLQRKGYLKTIEKKFLIKYKERVLTEKGEELEKRLYQFINYLHDYSLLNEREAFEVKIWEKLMIWAAFFGLTTVVKDQFEKLHPNISSERFFGYVGQTSAFTNRVESVTSSGSNSSSSGGGGGSFGGGSGGGTR